MRFILSKLNAILIVFTAIFMAGYLVFSGLTTSLDFEMERLLAKRAEFQEEHGRLLAVLAESRGRDTLISAVTGLGLVESTLADGYVDIRPKAMSAVGALAARKQ